MIRLPLRARCCIFAAVAAIAAAAAVPVARAQAPAVDPALQAAKAEFEEAQPTEAAS